MALATDLMPVYHPQNGDPRLKTEKIKLIQDQLWRWTCIPACKQHSPSCPPSGLPEKVALYFVSGICAGLIFLLCLFGLKSTLVQDVKELFSDLKDELKAPQGPLPELTEPDDDTASESSLRHLTHSYRTTEVFRPELMVRMVRIDGHEEEEELAKELPNGDIWLAQDSSPYAVHQLRAISAWQMGLAFMQSHMNKLCTWKKWKYNCLLFSISNFHFLCLEILINI